MPATKDGVDIYYRRDPQMDARSYSDRIKRSGVSLRNGDQAPVTTIRVKGKNIEFQIGGGGYGTAGDDTGSVTAQTVPKTRRETDLEKDIKNETDRRRREDMQRDLDRLRSSREREQQRRNNDAMVLQEEKRREIRQRALGAGSRFNIWYPEGYLRESVPTPQDLLATLRDYLDFGAAPAPSGAPSISNSSPIRIDLRRGMSPEQVKGILGVPLQYRPGKQGDLDVMTEMWEYPDMTVEVDYVSSLLVKYRVTSR